MSIAPSKKAVETLPRQDYEAHTPNLYFSRVVEPIANKWFSFREFKKVLKSIGLNIFPEPDSDKFVTVTNKVCCFYLSFLWCK